MKFPLEISNEYRKLVKLLNRSVIAFSIIISFFTIPFPISVLITVVLIGIGIAIEKIVFVYAVVYVNPIPPRLGMNQQTSIFYAYDFKNDVQIPIIGLVFKTKTEAIEKYQFLKAIANCRKDEANNLVVSFVFEDEKRYTLFLYPNKNRENAHQTKSIIESALERNAKAKLTIVSFVQYFPSTFTGQGNLKDILTDFINKSPIALNTYYFNNGQVLPARKTPILKYHIRILMRSELDEQDIEKKFEWNDPKEVLNK